MFGCGIYTADNSSKSCIYSHSSDCAQVGALYTGNQNQCTCYRTNGAERVMFLCRVCLGTPWIRLEATDPTKPLRRPPDREDGTPYDSVMGECKEFNPSASLAFREYIVYDRRQCYPEYIIKFTCEE